MEACESERERTKEREGERERENFETFTFKARKRNPVRMRACQTRVCDSRAHALARTIAHVTRVKCINAW